MKILTYELHVHSLADGPVDRPLPGELKKMPTNWAGYLLEAAENLSDLLPDGLYVTIEQPTREE